MKSCGTRSTTEHSIFGQPVKLPKRQLPTSEDVFKAYDFVFKEGQITGIHEISTNVAMEVIQIFISASIPTTELTSVIVRIKRLVEQVHKLVKYPDSKKSSQTFKDKLSSFKTLFDICCCTIMGYENEANVPAHCLIKFLLQNGIFG